MIWDFNNEGVRRWGRISQAEGTQLCIKTQWYINTGYIFFKKVRLVSREWATEGWEKDEESNIKPPKTCERWKDLSSAFPFPGFFSGWVGRIVDRRLRSCL